MRRALTIPRPVLAFRSLQGDLMRILIVDDSRAMRMIIRRSIRQAGLGDHEFMEATNGADAIDTILSNPPHVVMADWNMPEMSGLELLQNLADLPFDGVFGFITSESTDAMRALAVEAGARFFVTKPFSSTSLQRALGPWLS